MLILFTFVRIGEATVPGPTLADTSLSDDYHWLISGNSTGIAHKAQLLLRPRTTWLIQESHLTSRGIDHFRKELRAATKLCTPGLRWHSHAGHPVEPRREGTLVGKHAGVITFGPHPIRPLPTLLDPAMEATSRVQAVSLLIDHTWVHGVNAYGWTQGYTHLCPQAWTNLLLQDACAGLLSQTRGPRFLAGDLNHDLEDLPAMASLKEAGWVDLQTWLHTRHGWAIQPTCKGATQRDFLYLSPELQAMAQQGQLLPGLFPDHTALAVALQTRSAPIQAWPRPLHLDWDTAALANPLPRKPPARTTIQATDDYHALWAHAEATQPHAPCRAKGRAAALWPLWLTTRPAAPKTHPACGPACLQQGRFLDAL